MSMVRRLGIIAMAAVIGATVNGCGMATTSSKLPSDLTTLSGGCSNYVGGSAAVGAQGALPPNGKATTRLTAGYYSHCHAVPKTAISFTLQGVCGAISADSGVSGSNGLLVVTYRASSRSGACEITVHTPFGDSNPIYIPQLGPEGRNAITTKTKGI